MTNRTSIEWGRWVEILVRWFNHRRCGRRLGDTQISQRAREFPIDILMHRDDRWIVYNELHQYWQATNGGKDPARAYRHYVKQGNASRGVMPGFRGLDLN